MPDDEREIDEHFAIVEPEDEGDGQSLEDDPRLLELAKQAAQCMHEILGVRYDESHNVDIGDIKFVVVELTLPLGSKCTHVEIPECGLSWISVLSNKIFLHLYPFFSIFQEDSSGCWVTRIMPKGNADRNGQVEPGDQLAAINGLSAIGMKVDDICSAIANAFSGSQDVELTFLRYIGKFHPLPTDGDNIVVRKLLQEHGIDEARPPNPRMREDDKPGSSMSILRPYRSKESKKTQTTQPKRGLRSKFKWFGRGKKSSSKAE